ncbi:MAG: phosphomannomutase/phosphoglucomutase [Burkholderia sp.]|nr:phosphomannomutase/phosphoglucomutase [Burkholderia sp.]
MISKSLFKEYDIRGRVGKTLNTHIARKIGHAFGSEVRVQGGNSVVIARDGRLSSLELTNSIRDGLIISGVDVVDIGMVPTPVGYFAASVPLMLYKCKRQRSNSCIVVTGSHNPRDYNGFKMVLLGKAIYGEKVQELYQRIINERFELGSGVYEQINISDDYIDRIVSDVKLVRPIKIVVDTGNGVAGKLAPRLFKALDCKFIELFTDINGYFPNHHPDPANPKNLQEVIRALKETDAEVGLAFDGDGDRIGVVSKDGQIIFPDRLLMLFAEEILSNNPGAGIIYDVKCTRHLEKWIKDKGGKPIMWKSGHSLMREKLYETGALLAGEMSGHIFFKDRWYGFDDGLYTAARLLEILSKTQNSSNLLNALPHAISTPELKLKLNEDENFVLIDLLQKESVFEDAEKVVKIDGLRIEYPDGFGLIRSSNTIPAVVLRFESETKAGLEQIQKDFRRVLTMVRPGLKLPF